MAYSVLTFCSVCVFECMATQFGIKESVGGGVKWYSCIGDEKKKVYPGGYVGALTCPNVTAFCQMETISGEFYAENNSTVEWIGYIVVFVILLILFIVFCCVKKAQEGCAKCIKSSVGFERPSKHAELDKTNCQKCVPKVLMALCVIWDIIGLGLVILSVLIIAQPSLFWSSASRNVPHVLSSGIITAILASFGFVGARSNGPTIKICFYFYIVISVLIVSIVMAASAFWLTQLLETLFESAWDNLRFDGS